MRGDDQRQILRALAEADLRVLLMCLYQISGDRRWLEPPYTPKRDVRLVADPSAGLPLEAQEEIRRAAYEVLTGDPVEPAVPVPSEQMLQDMMSVCLGERVPAEYAPMMRAEMGFADSDPQWTDDAAPSTVPTVIIVGAGLSGIALGAQLSRLGIPYTIFEKNDGPGGTWWENTYPGAGVDTPNHAYSYSHGPRFHWTRFFALRGEIQDYIETSANQFDVRRHVSFRSTVVAADWDPADRLWRVDVRHGDGVVRSYTSTFLVSAVGILNTPRIPAIPGLDRFTGCSFHSARWPEGLDLSGKKVAIIGTGATAMQLVPALAGTVQQLDVYQRSPQWVRPVAGYRDDMPPGADLLMQRMPFYYEWFRFTMFWRYGDGLLKTLYKDPEWSDPERSVNRRNDLHRQELTAFIEEELAGRPDLVEKTLPTYPPFGKRILIDNGWYAVLREPHVDLVTDPITRIEEDAILTADGRRHPVDVIIFATGFDVTRLTASLNVRGRDGLDLADAWANQDPKAYLGIAVAGFPNMFLLLGPNTGLGHGGSTIFQSECQARYIAACMIASAEQGFDEIEVKQEVQDRYVAAVDAEHEKLIWTHPGMTNWYRNHLGRVIAIMPWRLVDFWHMTRRPRLAEYHLGSGDRLPTRR